MMAMRGMVLDKSLLRSVSRSFFITLNVLPATLRKPLGQAYLLARLSDTVADSAVASPETRLLVLEQLKREISGEQGILSSVVLEALSSGVKLPAERELLTRGLSLVEALHQWPSSILEPMRGMLVTIIEGQAGDIRRFEKEGDGGVRRVIALPDAAALDNYTYQVAGCVGEFWTRICFKQLRGFSRRAEAEMLVDGQRYGKALQLVNILRDLPHDIKQGRCYLPSDELAAIGITPDMVLDNPRLADEVFGRWLAVAHGHIEAAKRFIVAIRPRRVKFATALPADLALATLRLFQSQTPSTRLKISRSAVRKIALRRFFLTAVGR